MPPLPTGLQRRHAYAIGSLTISALASGVVDVDDLGFSIAGTRIQGFGAEENLGTDFGKQWTLILMAWTISWYRQPVW